MTPPSGQASRVRGAEAPAAAARGEAHDVVDILLVDDNADYLLLIQKAMESFDPRYRVTGVSSPEDAYELLERRSFQLVLLDYKFPRGGNGLQVIRTLKGKAFYVPTVMVTAFGDEGLAIQAMREGALDFIPKTSDFLQALPEVAARAIERGRIIRERIRTHRALERRNEELQVLNDIASAINVSRDPEGILSLAVHRLSALLGATEGAVHLVDDAGATLVAQARGGAGGEEDRVRIDGAPGSLLVRAVRRGEVLVERDEAGRTRCVVPLVARERTLGTFAFVLPRGREVSPSEGALAASIGKQVGLGVEHARLYQELATTRNYLQDLVGNAGDEVVTIDPWGKIISWNAGAEEIYGWTADAVVGRDWEALWPPERALEARALPAAVLERGETLSNHETTRVTREGHPVDILLTLSPLRNPDGSIRGVSCLGKNITFRKQLQAQLIQSEKMAAVGQLISGVAHELNNPLTAVLGYAQLVSSVETGDRLQAYLEKIAVEAGRCQKIVQNLLAFARKHEPKAARFDLNTILRETIELRAYDLRVNNTDVVVDLGRNLPSTLGDSHQLQQVFVNIINNAQQAIAPTKRKGRLVISTRVEERGLDGKPALVACFDDNGPGVPQLLRKKIFDPFFTTKAVGEGTGLGLSLSYGIIQEHGGQVLVGDSAEGGARFEVRLPVMPDLERERAAVREHVAGRPRPGPKRILVVDDQPLIREMVTDILSRDGHAIETVADGAQALRRIEGGERYDLIIVDLRMPELSGDRLYRAVRDLQPELAGRMVFATGDVVSSDTMRFLEGTGNRVLSKPFGVEDVRTTVSSFFEEHA